MAHQLYVLQVLTFNLLEDRMMTKMDPQDQVGGCSSLVKTMADGETVIKYQSLSYLEIRSFM